MTLEEKYSELSERLHKDAHKAVDAAISAIYCDLVPHINDDTRRNVSFQAGAIVRSILSNGFTRVDDRTVCASTRTGIDTFVTMTSAQHDNIRQSLLAAMPACPKDLEIENLKEQLKTAWERH